MSVMVCWELWRANTRECVDPYHTGASKHKVDLEGPNATVDDLKALLEKETEVPPDLQKIIFKGETVMSLMIIEFLKTR